MEDLGKARTCCAARKALLPRSRPALLRARNRDGCRSLALGRGRSLRREQVLGDLPLARRRILFAPRWRRTTLGGRGGGRPSFPWRRAKAAAATGATVLVSPRAARRPLAHVRADGAVPSSAAAVLRLHETGAHLCACSGVWWTGRHGGPVGKLPPLACGGGPPGCWPALCLAAHRPHRNSTPCGGEFALECPRTPASTLRTSTTLLPQRS